jgi:hypothetical protein
VPATYGVLAQRVLMNNDVLWRIIAFSLGAQVTAYVGLFQVKGNGALKILLGIATAGMGIIGPLTTRFVETVLLMDRLLLDRYEVELLGIDGGLLTHHSARMKDRIASWNQWLAPEDKNRLSERRGGAKAEGSHINKLLDLLGQPSLVWVAIMGLAGAVGFDIGIAQGIHLLWVKIVLCAATNLFMLVLWVRSSGLVKHKDLVGAVTP